jgi:hypothetical protein
MNQWEAEKGWDKQPRILGVVAFSDLRKDPHKNNIILTVLNKGISLVLKSTSFV